MLSLMSSASYPECGHLGSASKLLEFVALPAVISWVDAIYLLPGLPPIKSPPNSYRYILITLTEQMKSTSHTFATTVPNHSQ
jgi:hypothetical protein